MKTYKVYYHKNMKNNKYYIGITNRGNIKTRWGKEGKGYKTQLFYRAIQKYGWDNFEHKILYDNLSKQQAEEKEIELIEKYNSLIPNGYNVEKGGQTNYKNGKIICIDTNEIFENIQDVLEKNKKLFHNKITEQDIRDCCEFKRLSIKIPWRNLYYHYQYYTSNINEKIQKIKILEDMIK